MLKEFVNRVKAFVAEPAVGMALEAALVFGPRHIVTVAFVSPQFGKSKQFVFVGKHFLVPRAQVAGHLSVFEPVVQSATQPGCCYSPQNSTVFRLDVTMEIRPTRAGPVAGFLGAVVPQQQGGVVAYHLIVVLDPQSVIPRDDFRVFEVFKALFAEFGEYDKL